MFGPNVLLTERHSLGNKKIVVPFSKKTRVVEREREKQAKETKETKETRQKKKKNSTLPLL